MKDPAGRTSKALSTRHKAVTPGQAAHWPESVFRRTPLPLSLLVVALIAVLQSRCPNRNRPPDRPDAPVGADTGQRAVSYRFRALLTDPDGDSLAGQFLWDTADSLDWVGFYPSGIQISTWSSWPDHGLHELRVRSVDRHGAFSDWSEPHRIVVANHAPVESLALLASSLEPARVSTWFEFAVRDPDGDSVAYRFDWGDGDTSDWIGNLPSGGVIGWSHIWREPGSYQVRAMARDQWGTETDWTAPLVVGIAPNEDTRLKWWFRTGRLPASLALAPDGTVYAIRDKAIYALDADGNPRWQYDADDDVLSISLGQDGVLYGAIYDHGCIALNPDGTLRWQYGSRTTYSTPTIGPGGVVYLSDGAYVTALNPDGTLRWTRPIPHGTGVDSSALANHCPSPAGRTELECPFPPTIGPNGTVYIGADQGDILYALNPDGTIHWACGLDRGNGNPVITSATIADDGTLYVGAHHGDALIAVNADGTVRWWFDQSYWSFAYPPSLGPDGTIYCGEFPCDRSVSYDSVCLFAINPDGSVRWRRRISYYSFATSPAVAADGTVYFGTEDSLFALDSEGRDLWSWHNRVSSPTIGPDGTVYVGYYGICALVGPTGPANSAWPKYLHDARNSGWASGK